MRKNLQKIGKKSRHRFQGTFSRYGSKSGYYGPEKTILLTNITEEGTPVCDHLWFNATKGFQACDPQEGDILEFDARVAEYTKGYFGHRDDVYVPVQEDYKLSRPTKVVNVSHPERMEEARKKMAEEKIRNNAYHEWLQKEKEEERKHPPKATEAQMQFVTGIADSLGLDYPESLTKKEASSWIDAHIDAYKEARKREKEEERKKREAEKPAPPHCALLSIHPEYVEAILAGTKKFEFRKRTFSDSVDTILLYATSPVKEVLGEAKIANLVSGKPGKVWKKTEAYAGISREDFFAYFGNTSEAYAYELTDVVRYEEPKTLADYGIKRAPQSFVYVREETEEKKD